MKRMYFISLFILCIIFSSCSGNENAQYSESRYVIGTIVSITINSREKVEKEVFDKIFDQLTEIQNKMTINQDVNSEVEAINENAGKGPVKVSDDTFYVIQTGVEYTKLSDGRFDITVGPLVKEWNIGFENARVPSRKEIEDALALIGIEDIRLNEKEKTVELLREGMKIDLGGIAKGYAGDMVKNTLKDMGYSSSIINLGGNLLCNGSKLDGSDFKIGVRDPYGKNNDYAGIISMSDRAVVTSGTYERNFTEDGVLYHHILDTNTGFPVENNLGSVTIVTELSVIADALSTGVFALGLEEGMRFVESLDSVEAIFITEDKKIYLTEGIEDSFVLSNSAYHIQEQK